MYVRTMLEALGPENILKVVMGERQAAMSEDEAEASTRARVDMLQEYVLLRQVVGGIVAVAVPSDIVRNGSSYCW